MRYKNVILQFLLSSSAASEAEAKGFVVVVIGINYNNIKNVVYRRRRRGKKDFNLKKTKRRQ